MEISQIAIAYFFSIPMFVGGGYYLCLIISKIRKYKYITGRIVDYQKDEGMYYPIYEYEYNSKHKTYKSNISSSHNIDNINKKVKLIYNHVNDVVEFDKANLRIYIGSISLLSGMIGIVNTTYRMITYLSIKI